MIVHVEAGSLVTVDDETPLFLHVPKGPSDEIAHFVQPGSSVLVLERTTYCVRVLAEGATGWCHVDHLVPFDA